MFRKKAAAIRRCRRLVTGLLSMASVLGATARNPGRLRERLVRADSVVMPTRCSC